jgi:hypothetical protein
MHRKIVTRLAGRNCDRALVERLPIANDCYRASGRNRVEVHHGDAQRKRLGLGQCGREAQLGHRHIGDRLRARRREDVELDTGGAQRIDGVGGIAAVLPSVSDQRDWAAARVRIPGDLIQRGFEVGG